MEPGLSFVVRARNEEERIENALMSLAKLTIPYEIVVVLHLCTDRTEEITLACREKLGHDKVRVFYYDEPVSRAGLENVITSAKSKHSLVSFYTFSFSRAKYKWQFKYDADFIMTDSLAAWLNSWGAPHEPPTVYKIFCRIGDKKNHEPYLFNCLTHYTKYVFWETPAFDREVVAWELSEDCYIQSCDATVIKSYWDQRPWFLRGDIKDEDREEAAELEEKYKRLIAITGKPPRGMARAQSESYEVFFWACYNNQKQLKEYGIDLFS